MLQTKRQNKSKGLAYRLSRLLGERQRRVMVKRQVKSRCSSAAVAFPLDASKCRKVLIIMPEDEIEGFHQIPNLLCLLSFFHSASVTLMCAAGTQGFLRSLPGVSVLFEYERADRFLYSTVFEISVRHLFSEGFDVCVLLEKCPDLALLRLVGLCGATYRIGYDGAGEYPFLNLSVRQSPQRRYLSDANRALSRMIGANATPALRWTVARDAREEMAALLKDLAIGRNERLVGIDAFHFCRRFGRPWVGELLHGLTASLSGGRLFCPADSGADADAAAWLRELGVAVMPALNTSRMAALIDASTVLLSGNSLLFQIADLLGKPVVGLFEQETMEVYCKPSAILRGIAYAGKPDARTISAVCDAVSSCVRA